MYSKLLGVAAGLAVTLCLTAVWLAISGVLFTPTLGTIAAAVGGVGPSLAATVFAIAGTAVASCGGAWTSRRVTGRDLAPSLYGLLPILAVAGAINAGYPLWFWLVAPWAGLLAAHAGAKGLAGCSSWKILPGNWFRSSKSELPTVSALPIELEESAELIKPEAKPKPEPETIKPPSESIPLNVVKVEMPATFVMKVENGSLKLPSVQLVPTDPNRLPSSPRVEFSIGFSTGAGSFAKIIKEAYQNEADQFRQKLLARPHTISPMGVKVEEVLPRDSELTLTARLEYKYTNASGAAVSGPEATSSCRLTPDDGLFAWREVKVEPGVLVLSQGAQEESSVTIKVRAFGPPPSGQKSGATEIAKPSLLMTSKAMRATRELPELLEQLKRAAGSIRFLPPPPGRGRESADGVHEFLLSARLDLSERERRILADITRDRSLALDLRVRAPGALPAALTVEVESAGGQFPGQFAVDFGTSNSSITIYEPKEITPRPLPIDQLDKMRALFVDWLKASPDKILEGISEASFEEFASAVARNLNPSPNEQPLETIRKRFRTDGSDKAVEGMHEAIRQIELSSPHQQPVLRKALRVKLHEIYSETFRTFPFRQYNLTTLQLEGQALEMSSELEILATNPDLKARMGSEVREAREAFELGASGETAVGNATAVRASVAAETTDDPIVEGRFHRVPKRYLARLNRDRDRRGVVRVGRKSGEISRLDPSEIVGAAWNHLRGRFDDTRARNPEGYSKGRVRRAVVTYPTVLGPKARKEIEKLFHDMGVPTVRLIYDEAIAAAIFYLEKFFGGSYEVGPEAFKTRCRRQGEIWVQNMLVLDIGGGTTDVAMIRLEMRQEPFKEHDQGAGGRYYTITPTLLGSSGNEYLGGELITLRAFQLLKLAISDYVLKYESAMNYPPALSKARSAALARLGSSSYQSDSLIQLVAAPKNDPSLVTALEVAEEILPTRFKTNPAARGAFQALWREAEKLKIKVGQKRHSDCGGNDLPLSQTFDPASIAALLSIAWKGAGSSVTPAAKSQPLTINSEWFERAAQPVVEQALNIAKGLAESTLEKYVKDHPIPEVASGEKLDRIVLSGKSCNLHLVHSLLPRVMRQCRFYGDDVTEVLFEPELAKRATSLGACRAEEMWASLRPPEGWEATSRGGVSAIAFDIRNLFFFLPCSFWLKNQNEQLTDRIFMVHERYQMLDGTGLGKLRSTTPAEWLPPQPMTRVFRIDYAGDAGTNWGNFSLDDLAKALAMRVEELQRDLRVRFEVNNETLIRILLCKHGRPKYTFGSRAKLVGDSDVRRKLQEALKKAGKTPTADPLAGQALAFDIAIDPIEDKANLVVKAGTKFEHEAMDLLPALETLEANGPSTTNRSNVSGKEPVALKPVKFVLSEPLPRPPLNRQYRFYARAEGGENKWEFLGTIQLPRESGTFEENWHVAVGQDGYIRVVQGLPDYWEARVPLDLYDFPGSVLIADLQVDETEPNPDINPDSGSH